MLLFCLKISKKITLTAGSGLRFFIFQKHAFWTIINRSLNPILQKSVFLKNREEE